jgi:putative oxidoreductase
MTHNQNNSKTINIVLWILQALLAVLFILPGCMKLLQPIDELSKMLPWTGQVAPWMVRSLGLIDLLGGVGLILPAVLRYKPYLTVWAAYGSILLMVCAVIFHLSRGESDAIGFNIILLPLLVFIAWGRNKKSPILPKHQL